MMTRTDEPYIQIAGLGVLTLDEWERMGPTEHLSRVYPTDPTLPALYVGETPDAEDTYLLNKAYEGTGHTWAGRTSSLYTKDVCDLRIDMYGCTLLSPDDVVHVVQGIADGPLSQDTAEQVLELARVTHIAWSRDGYRVAVNCQAGLNRSSLVVAMMLMMEGATADAAIAQIRYDRSPLCLVNQHFVDFLTMNEDAIYAAGSEGRSE